MTGFVETVARVLLTTHRAPSCGKTKHEVLLIANNERFIVLKKKIFSGRHYQCHCCCCYYYSHFLKNDFDVAVFSLETLNYPLFFVSLVQYKCRCREKTNCNGKF